MTDWLIDHVPAFLLGALVGFVGGVAFAVWTYLAQTAS